MINNCLATVCRSISSGSKFLTTNSCSQEQDGRNTSGSMLIIPQDGRNTSASMINIPQNGRNTSRSMLNIPQDWRNTSASMLNTSQELQSDSSPSSHDKKEDQISNISDKERDFNFSNIDDVSPHYSEGIVDLEASIQSLRKLLQIKENNHEITSDQTNINLER